VQALWDRELMSAESSSNTPLQRTPLYDLHVSLGAKMVPFAGYEMPVQYPLGILKEHLHTREQAGLFDVSHMGQAVLVAADGSHATVAAALEALVPADILNLGLGQQRYTQLLNADGGILDDLMVCRSPDAKDDGGLMLIVNAACKHADYAHISGHLPPGVMLTPMPERALLALQGPKAAEVLADRVRGAAEMAFMTARSSEFDKTVDLHISRSGYTGEDGYELSIPAKAVATVWKALLADPRVQPIGLGARDSLRLEAGLCLYGHDIDETTSPIEAGLAWSIQKRRRVEGGFPGARRIQDELANGPKRRRVGIKPDGRAPAREGTEILALLGDRLGTVTSGGFGPSVNGPVAMGYVKTGFAETGKPLNLMVRGKALSASVVPLPFVPHRYVRSGVRPSGSDTSGKS
jgi:aminomethyltransferase